MTRSEPETRTERIVQRESDHQRWSDDGGAAPSGQSLRADTAPVAVRWALLTKRLELRARWRAFCTQLVARAAI